jgi:hypothetical protein
MPETRRRSLRFFLAASAMPQLVGGNNPTTVIEAI